MELDKFIFGESNGDQKADASDGENQSGTLVSFLSSDSEAPDDLSHGSESFSMQDLDAPRAISIEKKLSWLRSQIVVGDAEFSSPFGTRRITYADHTASGRGLHFIENYIVNNVLPFYGNTHTCDSFVGDQTTKMVHEATKYVKRCLGGKPDDALLFCGSGTTAAIKRLQEVMGITAPSIVREKVLETLRNEERWVVFVGPYEHHSNLLSWRQSLADVVEIGLDDNGLLDIEALRQKLESYQHANRPLLGSFSACSNVTGIYSNTRALAELLHQYGAFACFDFAASGPYVEVDMRSGEIDGYDAIFLSPHKFLGGPGTSGILLMSKILYRLGSSPPSTCGGGTVSFDTLYADDIEEREDAGTPPIIQKIRTALTFWVKEYIGYNVIEQLEHKYTEAALQRLLPNQNIRILGNTTEKRQAILSFLVYSTTNSSSDGREETEGRFYMWRETGNKRGKPLDGPFVAKLLNDLFGIQARGGCACAGPYGHSLLNVTRPVHLHSDLPSKIYLWPAVPSFVPLQLENRQLDFQEEGTQRNTSREGKQQNFGDLSLARAMQTFDLTGAEEHHNADDNDQVVKKYTSYLETAKYIASLLRKFPPQRRVPEDIELGLVSFRV
ncbi:putative cysteine desulfurase [Vitis vinifera]|uniref:Putative cysteine desulfurase n=1 Tax=Vitis vinifera TaxID=29760 RepID=A0A438HQW6_VITVI|nr:putative cysteine desulfurase [Vitis vinifera]